MTLYYQFIYQSEANGKIKQSFNLICSCSWFFSRMQLTPLLQKFRFSLLILHIRYTCICRTNIGASRRFKCTNAFSASLGINCMCCTNRLVRAYGPTITTQPRHTSTFTNNNLVSYLLSYILKNICLNFHISGGECQSNSNRIELFL